MTGKVIQLRDGLTAVETVLGWTITGQVPKAKTESTAMFVTANMVNEATIQDLWSLEAIGIQDPSEKKSQEKLEMEATAHFMENMTRAEDGRYSV